MSDASAELIGRARSLAPLLAEHAAEAERLRRPVDAVIEALREARIFDLMVPRCHGGLELDLDAFLEVGLALGEGDASMSWVATFYVEHNWMLCQLPESFQKELYADRSHVLAPGAIAPNGRATPVEGGFRLDGRWQWGTGIAHAEWVLVGVRVEAPGDEPDMRFLVLPVADVEVEDTWFVDGMAGTGSADMIVRDQFVPAERSASIQEMGDGRAPGSRLHAGPLYRTPMLPILALAAAMPAVGQARTALRGFRARLEERKLYGTGVVQARKAAAQMRLARAEIEVRQAEELLRRMVDGMMALRDRATLADRARWIADAAFAVDQSKRVLHAIADASGASAHFLSHPLQRAVRDVDTLSCHVVFDLDARLEMHGRAMLGLEPRGMV
ncbi:MAG: acyl-CoA dehydrogenase [Myxococcota bacterium]|nr:acyl-CoA dehydrogenase [Myxococcota bacterium]